MNNVKDVKDKNNSAVRYLHYLWLIHNINHFKKNVMFTSIIVCWNETQQQLLNNCHFIIFFHAKEQFTTTVQYVSHNFVERLLLYQHPPDSECFKIKIPLAIEIFLLFSLSMWTDDNWSTGEWSRRNFRKWTRFDV